MTKIPFHQYQRYKMVQLLVENLRENKKMKILEVGANEHKNLEKFLPNDEIFYLDIELSEEKLKDKQYIKGDATDLQFKDNEFDYIIALDVFEHIPKQRRELFFENINRVSKYGFIASFPFDNKETIFVEDRIEHIYKYMYNQTINWHEEHKEMGLPTLKDVNYIVKNKMNIKTRMLYHGDNYLFEKLMNIEALNNTDGTLNNYWDTINTYYNENIFYQDRVENERNAIRTFMIYHKNFEKLQNCITQMNHMISTSGESKKKILNILNDFSMNVILAQISGKNERDKERNQQLEQFYVLKNEYDKLVKHTNMLTKEYNNQSESRQNLEEEYNKLIKYIKGLEEKINILGIQNNNLKQENDNLKQENNNLNISISELLEFKENIINTKMWKIRNKLKKS